MSCLPCFGSKKSNSKREEEEEQPLPVAQARELPPTSPTPQPQPQPQLPPPSPDNNNSTSKHAPSPPREEAKNEEADDDDEGVDVTENGANAKTFTFRELASATKNFRQECLLGESGFGKVYRGTLQSSGQVVAVKQLDRNGMQGNKEFLVEVLMLTLLHHPNLVDLIGYCADGDQRLLVYEYMPGGSLKTHLHDVTPDKKPLDWNTRMRIASGAAQGLEYLHEKANPPVIYRDLKASNILLDEVFNPRLTDYGLAKLGLGNNMLPSQRMMGTYGYSSPEYERTGELTMKSDIYSFGVVLLELITGRRAMDTNRPTDEQNLVSWAQPYFRDPKRFPELADPLLNSKFPVRSLNQAVGVAAMCLQDEPSVRPLVGDVVAALSFLINVPSDEPSASPPPNIPSPANEHGDISNHQRRSSSSSSSSDDDDDGAAKKRQSSKKEVKKYHEDSGSSSESLYHEDEDEDSGEEGQQDVKKSMKGGSKSRTKSKKRNIGKSEDGSISGNSSRRSSNSSFSSAQQQQRGYSGLSRKSTEKSRHSNNGSVSSRNSSDDEESSGHEESNSRQDSQARSVFSLDSRCYSNTDGHDESTRESNSMHHGNEEED